MRITVAYAKQFWIGTSGDAALVRTLRDASFVSTTENRAFRKLELMITLCTRCHAIVERTQMVLGEMTPLLLILWREKHPDGQEQLYLPLDAELPRVAEQLRIPVEILH